MGKIKDSEPLESNKVKPVTHGTRVQEHYESLKSAASSLDEQAKLASAYKMNKVLRKRKEEMQVLLAHNQHIDTTAEIKEHKPATTKLNQTNPTAQDPDSYRKSTVFTYEHQGNEPRQTGRGQGKGWPSQDYKYRKRTDTNIIPKEGDKIKTKVKFADDQILKDQKQMIADISNHPDNQVIVTTKAKLREQVAEQNPTSNIDHIIDDKLAKIYTSALSAVSMIAGKVRHLVDDSSNIAVKVPKLPIKKREINPKQSTRI